MGNQLAHISVPVVKYTIEVYTANEPGADTEAELFIQLFGSHGDSGKRILHHCLNNMSIFQQGQMDTFQLEAVTLQDVEKVVIGHEEKGKGGSLFWQVSCHDGLKEGKK